MWCDEVSRRRLQRTCSELINYRTPETGAGNHQGSRSALQDPGLSREPWGDAGMGDGRSHLQGTDALLVERSELVVGLVCRTLYGEILDNNCCLEDRNLWMLGAGYGPGL